MGTPMHLVLEEQSREVTHTEEKNGENKNQLDQSCGKIFLEAGTTEHAQETSKVIARGIREETAPCVLDKAILLRGSLQGFCCCHFVVLQEPSFMRSLVCVVSLVWFFC